MRDNYKDLPNNFNSEDVREWMVDVTRKRQFDVVDYDNQVAANPVFFQTPPTSSSDLKGFEKAGDMAADASYLYVVVDNTGLVWRRVAISSF